jgi:hypothetical protein
MPQHQKEEEMPQTESFTEEEVSGYLDDPIVTDDHSLGDISTCVRVIGRYEPGNMLRSEAMVTAAMESIASWASDYGVEVDFIVK